MYQFKVPFTACLAAPSGSGKSTWILKFLQYLPVLVDKPFDHIVWCFGEESGIPTEILNDHSIQRHRGVPTEQSGVLRENTLIILDDLMSDCYNKCVSELYTKGSRHRKISVFLLTQNLFHQSKHSRDISLSTRYFILLRNVRDRAQFVHLARQIYPENPSSLCEALGEAWSTPFSYLLIDLDPSTNDSLRFRSNIWPSDPYMIVFASDKGIDSLHASGQTDVIPKSLID